MKFHAEKIGCKICRRLQFKQFFAFSMYTNCAICRRFGPIQTSGPEQEGQFDGLMIAFSRLNVACLSQVNCSCAIFYWRNTVGKHACPLTVWQDNKKLWKGRLAYQDPTYSPSAAWKVVSYPTRWSLLFILDFCMDHLSWQWRPNIDETGVVIG